MQREPKAYLWDIAQAAASIRSFTAGKSLADYLADELLRSAVERKFGIVGSAPFSSRLQPRQILPRLPHAQPRYFVPMLS